MRMFTGRPHAPPDAATDEPDAATVPPDSVADPVADTVPCKPPEIPNEYSSSSQSSTSGLRGALPTMPPSWAEWVNRGAENSRFYTIIYMDIGVHWYRIKISTEPHSNFLFLSVLYARG